MKVTIITGASSGLGKAFAKNLLNNAKQDDEFWLMPDKNNPNLAKTPQFSRFLSNARLKYVKYIFVRLCQKSSKISVFWSIAEVLLGYESDGEFLD